MRAMFAKKKLTLHTDRETASLALLSNYISPSCTSQSVCAKLMLLASGSSHILSVQAWKWYHYFYLGWKTCELYTRQLALSGNCCGNFLSLSCWLDALQHIPQKDNFLRGDGNRRVQHQQQQQRKPRKKTKPPALTKKHKKKRRRGPRRPQKPIPPALPQGNLGMPSTSLAIPSQASIRSATPVSLHHLVKN